MLGTMPVAFSLLSNMGNTRHLSTFALILSKPCCIAISKSLIGSQIAGEGWIIYLKCLKIDAEFSWHLHLLMQINPGGLLVILDIITKENTHSPPKRVRKR